jgi:DNA-binding protein H-NS
MPTPGLGSMGPEALLALRAKIEGELGIRRAEIAAQLVRLGQIAGSSHRRGRASLMKGRKVPPKYRGPSGETWSGRGAKPRWLTAALKGGKTLDFFLIDKSVRRKTKKRKLSSTVTSRASQKRGKAARRVLKKRPKRARRPLRKRVASARSSPARITVPPSRAPSPPVTSVAQVTTPPPDGGAAK